jgi:hemerythrin
MGRPIVWKPLYSVGNVSVDNQHKQILEIVNDLHMAMEEGNDHEVVKSLLDRMLRYTHTHFEFEERLMQECGYPDIESHKGLHDVLRRKTTGLRAHTNLVMEQDLLRFLKEWWVEHIQEEDQKFAPYLAASVAS